MKDDIQLDKLVRTTCRGCEADCGVLVHVKDGKVIKIEGDPVHPKNRGFICAMGSNYAELLYSPERLKFPMKKPYKGAKNWERISWEEALDTIAAKFLEIRGKYGPLSIAVTTGNLNKERATTALFARSLGTSNFTVTGYV